MSWKDLAEYGRIIVESRPLLFCGSGLSRNAGYPPAETLAQRIARELGTVSDEATRYRSDLGAIAQIARNQGWSLAQIAEAAFGKPDPASERAPWYTFEENRDRYVLSLSNDSLSIPHVVLARLAREGFISEILTTNYDSCIELACWASGMDRRDAPKIVLPSICRDYFRVLSNRASYESLIPDPSTLYVAKLHGSIDAILNTHSPRQWVNDDDNRLAIAFEDLTGWSVSRWARSYFEDRVKSRLMLVTGFSASDPYLFGTLLECLPEPGENRSSPMQRSQNRVYALDPTPGVYLRTVVSRAGALADGLVPEADCTDCSETSECTLGRLRLLSQSSGATSEDERSVGMSCLFSDLYCACISQALLAHLETVALPTLVSLLGNDGLAKAYYLLDVISAFLHNGVLPTKALRTSAHDLLFEWLPKALVIAAIVTASARGNVLQRTDKWSRPDFYYPIVLDLPLAFALLATLFRVADQAPSGARVLLRRDGGVDLLFERDRPVSVLLLPVLQRTAEEPLFAKPTLERRFFSALWRSPEPKPLVVIGCKDSQHRPRNQHQARFMENSAYPEHLVLQLGDVNFKSVAGRCVSDGHDRS